jgi:hypothetical protein
MYLFHADTVQESARAEAAQLRRAAQRHNRRGGPRRGWRRVTRYFGA